MTTDYSVAAVAEAPSMRFRSPPPTSTGAAAPSSAVHYSGRRNSRSVIIAALVISASAHAGLLLGIGPPRKKVVVAAHDDAAIIRLAIPDIKELEEPEPVPNPGDVPPPDLGILIPMQADLPQLPQPNDFVQQLNFASLLEQPDFSKMKIYAVPEHIRTSGSNLAGQFGKIFNIDDLDRIPEPVLQPAPVFPVAMRREAQSAKVIVEFIVDTTGKVLDPVIIDTSHHGFDDAAMSGVSRWKFKAGLRAGKKVNTRMRVPIIFKLLDPLD